MSAILVEAESKIRGWLRTQEKGTHMVVIDPMIGEGEEYPLTEVQLSACGNNLGMTYDDCHLEISVKCGDRITSSTASKIRFISEGESGSVRIVKLRR